MRYDWNRNRYGPVNRVMSWFIMTMAALSWPGFAFLAARDGDWTLILAALIITAPTVLHRFGLRAVYGVKDSSEGDAPQPLPEPKAPRDMSRPYPRPKNSRSKLNRVCPVCGTGTETTGLDGKLLGWPAHASCAEWLGDWRPERRHPVASAEEIARVQQALDNYSPSHGVIVLPPGGTVISVENSPGTQVNVGSGTYRHKFPRASMPFIGGTATTIMMSPGAPTGPGSAATYSVPPPALGATWSAAGDRQPLAGKGTVAVRTLGGVPTYRWRCACGATAAGTAPTEALAGLSASKELAAHSGACPLPPF